MTNEFPNKPAFKRGRESPEKTYKPKKQTKISNYWLGSAEHMQIIQIDLKFLIQLIKTISSIKFQTNNPIFIESVSNIKPLYDLLNEVAKDLYDLKMINSAQVKIQAKTSDA